MAVVSSETIAGSVRAGRGRRCGGASAKGLASSALSLVDQTKVVTAASELARNTLIYGGGGSMQLESLNGPRLGCDSPSGQRSGHSRHPTRTSGWIYHRLRTGFGSGWSQTVGERVRNRIERRPGHESRRSRAGSRCVDRRRDSDDYPSHRCAATPEKPDAMRPHTPKSSNSASAARGASRHRGHRNRHQSRQACWMREL